MFHWFRGLIGAMDQLSSSVTDLARAQREAGPAIDRLEALELSRHHFEAEVESTLLRAEGKLKAASNAEARERQLKKSYERLVDDLDPVGEPGPEAAGHDVLPLHAEAGEAERLSAMRLDVASNNKTAAVRAKFGL